MVPLGSNKARVVLATLLLAENRPVPVDTLIDRLWGAHPPASAKATVQVHVMRLRQALDDDQLVQTTAGGYRIEVPAPRADIAQFHDLLGRARLANVGGDVDTEAALLTDALRLWRGPALLGVQSESLHQVVVPALNDERLQAVERVADIALAQGWHEDLVGELTALVGEYPLRERLWLQLIDVLRRSGRRVEALDFYRRMRQLFREKLGIDPGVEVQRLHQQILAEDVAPAAAAPAPHVEPPIRPGQLPPDLPDFIGRVEAKAELRSQLESPTPLVIVSGSPGVGKTAFVVHVAHQVRDQYPDGQLYVNLQGHSLDEPLAPALVLERFLFALGVPASQVPAEEQEQTNLYRSVLADRRVLVVLDNAATPSQVRPLLPGGKGSAVLVTSRDDLRGLAVTGGGRHVLLEPLCQEEALDVLVEMVGKARIAAEPDAAHDVVLACGGLPLALRIAGANLLANPHLPVADYADELRGREKVVRLQVQGDAETAVRAAFDLSYLRLPADAARLFRMLGVVPGPDFTAPAAAALIGVASATHTLNALVAANLVQPSAPGRYQVHDLIRAYAAARAEEHADESRAAADRLFDFYLHTARGATLLLYPDSTRLSLPAPAQGVRPIAPATEEEARSWLAMELPNLVAAAARAHDVGKPRYARQLALTVKAYVSAEGHGVEGLAVCAAALVEARRAGDVRAEAALLDLIGLIHYVSARHERAAGYHLSALEINRDTGDHAVSLTCLHNLARAHAALGQHVEAAARHQEALELARLTGDRAAQILNLAHLGFVSIVVGRLEVAADSYRQVVEMCGDGGDRTTLTMAHNGLGLVAWARGELRESVARHGMARSIAAELGDDNLLGFSTIWLAAARCAVGDYEQAIADARAGIELGRATGEPRHEVSGALVTTNARYRMGQTAGALEEYRVALSRAREIGFVYGEIPLLIAIATTLRVEGDPRGGLDHAEQALLATKRIGSRVTRGKALIEIAHCLIELGSPECAHDWLDQALELAVTGGHRMVEANALHVFGLMWTALEDPTAAVDAWQRAHEIFTDVGAPEAADVQALIGQDVGQSRR